MKAQKTSKRILCLLLMLALAVPLLPASTAYGEILTPPAGYTGIYTAQDLSNMRNNLAGNYILMTDLDLTAYTATGDGWIPVGTKAAPFTGILDGNGHAITGLRIYKPVINTASFVGGLFGYASGAQIRNLRLTASFDVTVMRAVRYAYLGGLAGCGTALRISGTSVTLKAKARAETVSVGGLVGYATAPLDLSAQLTTIENCTASGDVNTLSRDYDLGGLVGRSVSLKASNCTSAVNLYGLVTAANYRANMGGIAGTVQSFDISGCLNKGKLTLGVANKEIPVSAIGAGGGIAGQMLTGGGLATPLSASISGCVNEATISSLNKGRVNLGGIAAELTEATLEDCTNKGKVIGNGDEEEEGAAGILAFNFAGTVRNCINEGNVTAWTGDKGGIVAANRGSIIACANRGELGNGGGICDTNYGTVQQCANTGTIGVGAYQSGGGGLVNVNLGEISDCCNTGQIVGLASGGIAGWNNTEGVIRRCLNLGIVQSEGNPGGGIAGANYGTIEESYYHGTIAAGIGDNQGTDGTIRRTFTQLQSAGSFPGFDFTEDETPAVWAMSANSGLPCLTGVPEVYLTSLAVQKRPYIYSYLLGEPVVLDGLGLKATYSDGRTALIDQGYTLLSYARTDGDQNITLQYLGKSASFAVHYGTMKLTLEDSTRIMVDWIPVPKMTQMRVYLAEAAAGPYRLAMTGGSDVTGGGFIDLLYGKTYYFKIRPMFGTTYGTLSPYASMRMRPNAPASVQAQMTETGVYLTWGYTAYSEDYEVYYSQNVGGPYVKLGSASERTAYLHTTAAHGTRYYYAVKSYVVQNGTKYYSDFSEIESVFNL